MSNAKHSTRTVFYSTLFQEALRRFKRLSLYEGFMRAGHNDPISLRADMNLRKLTPGDLSPGF